MRVKLRLNRETENLIREELISKEIEVSENAELILTEEDYHAGNLRCRDGKEIVVVPFEQICYIESMGHDVFVQTVKKRYKTNLRIYQLESILPENQFVRISSGIIIQRNAVKKIRPALSCKFYLTLEDGVSVTVTRTYYYKFKSFYGI